MSESDTTKSQPFKVLIAGGSIAGLGLALALERAGIDYELFEKGQFATQLGASIGFFPHCLRILDQLGVWSDIERVITPIIYRNHYSETGRCFEESVAQVELWERLGRPVMFMERCKVLKILYNHVADKAKLHENNGILDYEETEKGVTVTTQNGATHHGSILVGADGVHSCVREIMAQKTGDAKLAKQLVEGFTSQFNCVFGVSNNNAFLPDGTVHNTYNHGYSGIVAAGVPGLAFWFFFIKATKKTRMPNCPRFTDEDAEAIMREYGSAQAGPGYTFHDLWEARVKASMAALEEGVLEKWSHGRAVLIGDAVHKATINAGMGGNIVYEGIAHLTNILISLLKSNPTPTTANLTAAFDQYHTLHSPRANLVVTLSGKITRSEAQDNWFYKFFAQHINPLVSDHTKANLFVLYANGAPWLEYLPLPAVDARLLTNKVAELEEAGKRSVLGALVRFTAVAVAGAVVWHRYGPGIQNLAGNIRVPS
ncbi:FAD-dependent oxidoreductase [Aspergillus stella-maris]|uniref:FAD-dependent oxidoreductase n=1 Tax=Aspergillus stella-maris TaxID=1810926 RepID=UPI003CCC9524